MATKGTTPAFNAELLDELLKGQDPHTVLSTDGLLDDLKKALAERMLNAEMDVHLDSQAEHAAGNHRNGSSEKTVLSDDGELVLSIPRDRHGRFDPALIAKYQRRFPGFDDKIIALYARGMRTRDIQGHVRELYGVSISPDLVSVVTDSVIEQVRAWQSRPLESTYAVVFFDALRVKIRVEGLVRNKAMYLAIGMRCSGHKEVLGLWIEQTEGAKFWLRVMNELRSRGLNDILIAVVDGLKGFPEAITGVFPDTVVQTSDCACQCQSSTPDWGTVLSRAAAIVTNRGGRTCHAATVARELGVPAVVGSDRATEGLTSGDTVTVSCAEGDVGRIYTGAIPFEVQETDLSVLERPATQIMINLGNPELAFKTAMLPNDGVGLARLEFIVSEYVKAHPMALLHMDKVSDLAERKALATLVRHHHAPADFFVEKLSEGVGMIAAAFYPKPVVVRLSDFKSNEYASLLGGAAFELHEENPMFGFRGASRYDHPAYAEGFVLECAAMKRVRDDMGFTNVKLMVPFCRRVPEAEKVIAAMANNGLARGVNGLEIYVMCEIPNNVMLIDEFAKHFDGFSIGSNDLTQLTLGVDRDSEIVAFDFDERDPGVKKMLRLAVEGAQRNQRHCGICGQAPSDYPEIAEYLVGLGIDSMSLSPDSVLATTQRVLALEKARGAEAG